MNESSLGSAEAQRGSRAADQPPLGQNVLGWPGKAEGQEHGAWAGGGNSMELCWGEGCLRRGRECLLSAALQCPVGQPSMAAFLAVFEVHDSDVEGLLRNLRDESQAMSDGVVLLRGLPFTSTEEDIADFFSGNSAWAMPFLYQAFTSLSRCCCSSRDKAKCMQPQTP